MQNRRPGSLNKIARKIQKLNIENENKKILHKIQ